MNELEWAEKYREHAYHILEELKRIAARVEKLEERQRNSEKEIAVAKTKLAVYGAMVAAGISAIFKWAL